MVFKKGQSGNPSGRPKVVEKLRKRALRAVREHVLQAWVDEVRGEEKALTDKTGNAVLDRDGNIVLQHQRGPDWVKCSELLAAYGMGKPVQPVAPTNQDGDGPAEFIVRFAEPPKRGAK